MGQISVSRKFSAGAMYYVRRLMEIMCFSAEDEPDIRELEVLDCIRSVLAAYQDSYSAEEPDPLLKWQYTSLLVLSDLLKKCYDGDFEFSRRQAEIYRLFIQDFARDTYSAFLSGRYSSIPYVKFGTLYEAAWDQAKNRYSVERPAHSAMEA